MGKYTQMHGLYLKWFRVVKSFLLSPQIFIPIIDNTQRLDSKKIHTVSASNS